MPYPASYFRLSMFRQCHKTPLLLKVVPLLRTTISPAA